MEIKEKETFNKNVTLGAEFDKYLIEHPEFAEQIPPNAVVILLPEDDPDLCQQNLKMIDHHRQIDDFPSRQIVFVRIERLAPPAPSRLINPRLEVITV